MHTFPRVDKDDEKNENIIQVYSLDFDGLLDELSLGLLNAELANKKYGERDWAEEIAHSYLLQQIFFAAQMGHKVILLNGSSRQTVFLDFSNRHTNLEDFGNVGGDAGSCFAFLGVLKKFIKDELAKSSRAASEHIHLDLFSLDDLYKKQRIGTTFTNALKLPGVCNSKGRPTLYNTDAAELDKLHQKAAEEENLSSLKYKYDDSKITLLYAQIHHIAQQHPEAKINFNFYDDRPDLCILLHTIYAHWHSLLPRQVKLNIFNYMPELEKIKNDEPKFNYLGIQGSGAVDDAYQMNAEYLFYILEEILGNARILPTKENPALIAPVTIALINGIKNFVKKVKQSDVEPALKLSEHSAFSAYKTNQSADDAKKIDEVPFGFRIS